MQGLLGAGAASAAGFAMAKKLDGEDAVIVCSIGDGAMSEGVVYETMNMAAIHDLPIVYVVENNQIAMSTPVCEQAPHEDLYLRAHGYNIPGMKVDGNDVEAVTNALLGAIEMAAAGKPVIVECKTYRWTGHYVGDMQRYRDTGFLKNTDGIDPLKLYGNKLVAQGVATQEELDRITNEQNALMSDAFQRAWEAEFPTREDCVNYDNLYSNNAGGAL
jgi:pyruvate dehydrogenase E1 component alpha subunit